MSEAPRAVSFPLKLKLMIFGGSLAVAPALAVGFGLMEVNAATLETQNRELRLAVAEDIAGSIEGAIDEARGGLVGVQQVLTDARVSEAARVDVATALVEADALLDTVAIYDQSGGYITQIDQTGRGLGAQELPADLAQRASAAAVVVDGWEVDDGGRARVEMVLAIRPEPSEVTGFLRTRVELGAAQARTERVGARQLSARSRIDVVDVEGRVLLSTEAQARGEELAGAGVMKALDTIVEQGVAHSGDHPERAVLVSALPLQAVPWVVRVEVPTDEAYASLGRMRWIVGLGTGAAAASALLMALVFARRLTRPLDAVVRFTEQLAARAFDARVTVDTRDEIGVVAAGLNEAAAELKASEEKLAEELAIRSDLGRYLPEDLVENVVRREQVMELGGVRRQITVLFADVVRFTPLCEHHEPEVVVSVLNELFTLMTTVIFGSGGTVDKFIGDCVMAFWGAPRADDQQVLHALDAAERIHRVLEFANRRWTREFGVEVRLAMGVHVGEAVVGNVGSRSRMEYTAIGKAVNLAARLEALAHDNQVLVTDEVRAAAGGRFAFRRVSTELLTVGGEEAVVWEVLL